jgi:hypothetical protein
MTRLREKELTTIWMGQFTGGIGSRTSNVKYEEKWFKRQGFREKRWLGRRDMAGWGMMNQKKISKCLGIGDNRQGTKEGTQKGLNMVKGISNGSTEHVNPISLTSMTPLRKP